MFTSTQAYQDLYWSFKTVLTVNTMSQLMMPNRLSILNWYQTPFLRCNVPECILQVSNGAFFWDKIGADTHAVESRPVDKRFPCWTCFRDQNKPWLCNSIYRDLVVWGCSLTVPRIPCPNTEGGPPYFAMSMRSYNMFCAYWRVSWLHWPRCR